MPGAAAWVHDRIDYAHRLPFTPLNTFELVVVCILGISINVAAMGSYLVAGHIMDHHITGIMSRRHGVFAC